MSAYMDRDLQALCFDWGRLRNDRQAAILQVARKMDSGSLDVDCVNDMIKLIQCGSVTYDEGLAALASTH